ncbi:MAG: excinuclease ABC subunit UvrA [Helicobacteraceae bacterium]
MDTIKIFGAKENNLKNINLEIPKNKLVVFTGLSGSGKSTLAFDTLYAEGQRRYIESLSSYARQFLDKVGKPDVQKIEGLMPAIAIDQKTTSKNPRSTVGTITEIYDYLRLLFARVGKQYCHQCGKPISSMSASDIIAEINALPQNAKLVIMAPIVKEKKGTFADTIEALRAKGFVRAQIDGVMTRLDEDIDLGKNKKHTIKVVIDRLIVKDENKERIAQSTEKGLKEGFGQVEVEITNAAELGAPPHIHYSEHTACFDCKISFEELEPLAFSFNSPKGACSACDGLGIKYVLDYDKIFDKSQSLASGGVRIFIKNSFYHKFLLAFCQARGIDTSRSFDELSEQDQNAILHGSADLVSFSWKRTPLKKTFGGVSAIAYEMLKNQRDFEDYVTEKTCPICGGRRLKKESLAVRVGGKTIGEILELPIEQTHQFFTQEANFTGLSAQQQLIAAPILKEIRERLFFLYDVGLGYITLGRDARTISGGESQRIRIASQIGSGLTGVMYVLDEPSIGLHERDTQKLIKTLKNLRDKGNSVFVVEHDKETILQSDFVVDIGPGAGKYGGEIIYADETAQLKTAKTPTADYIFGRKKIEYFRGRAQKDYLEIKNVSLNNIKDLSVSLPLGNLVCVTGVSGSGKSSLILQTLLPVAQEILNHARKIKTVKGVECLGLEKLDKVIYLDQSPIGRTPRSIPATYTGMMDDIRELFSSTKEAKLRGYSLGRFSFNVKGGRCEKCSGDGEIKIEMHFLPDILVKCDACGGTRYNAQTLEVTYKDKNISEVLNMSVDEACEFFASIPKIYAKARTLQAVGLGYITLGQNAVNLSGGEAQRIKLAKELSRKDTGKTLYILDEPTTGLHFADIDKLIGVLNHLVDLGNSVVVIEHNLDVIKNADYIIDMGPEGGSGGGRIVAQGTPRDLAKTHKKTGSYTGQFLKQELGL